MIELTVSIDVASAPERVFDALTDWNRQGEWMPGTDVRVTEGNGTATGDVIVARTAVRRTGFGNRLGFDDPMRITVWQRPSRCDVRHLGNVVRGTGAFLVAPQEGGSRFTWSEQVEAPFGRLGAYALRLGRPVAQAGLKTALKRFARWVERGS